MDHLSWLLDNLTPQYIDIFLLEGNVFKLTLAIEPTIDARPDCPPIKLRRYRRAKCQRQIEGHFSEAPEQIRWNATLVMVRKRTEELKVKECLRVDDRRLSKIEHF